MPSARVHRNVAPVSAIRDGSSGAPASRAEICCVTVRRKAVRIPRARESSSSISTKASPARKRRALHKARKHAWHRVRGHFSDHG